MDWRSNAHAWDFTHFPQQPIPEVDALGGTGEYLVDLKLGQEGEATGSRNPTSTPVKRLRAAANAGIQPAGCLVDGCDSDLSNCREYHRRHKVCERHSKTPEVIIAGHKKRFCQQCSRFHSLEEFDEEKRSCRKRLDGHNRRRRKPQPEPAFQSANFMPGHQGMELSPFSAPPMYHPNLHHGHKQHEQLSWKQSPFFMEGGGGAQLPCMQPGEFAGTQIHALEGPSSSGSSVAPSLLSVLVPQEACTVPSWETRLPHCSSPAEQQLPVHFPNMLEAMELGEDPGPVSGHSSVDGSGKVPETIPFYWE